jgi:hypothetical protein
MPFNQTSFKKADIIIQSAALVIIGAIWFFDSDFAMMAFFLGMGGWQLLSMSIHLIQRWNQHNLGRRIYQYTLLSILGIFLISLISATIMIWVLYLLLFVTPLLAFYYLVICYMEIWGRKRI